MMQDLEPFWKIITSDNENEQVFQPGLPKDEDGKDILVKNERPSEGEGVTGSMLSGISNLTSRAMGTDAKYDDFEYWMMTVFIYGKIVGQIPLKAIREIGENEVNENEKQAIEKSSEKY